MPLRKEFLIVLFLLAALFAFSYFEPKPLKELMDWRSSVNALREHDVMSPDYEIYDHTTGKEPELTIDFLKGKHFWHPQIAIWLEDSVGNYVETLLVTKSTAQGLFYSGRSATNFKLTDNVKTEENTPTRRVDALPYWSHKRGHQYFDGLYSPPSDDPLPDGITGATPKENFYFKSATSSIQDLIAFRVLIEVNVAFDDNEFYSEYDFLEDSSYHGGTGLLGQPSLVYSATIKKSDMNRYYFAALVGHGHHSGMTGELIPEMQTLTTAKYIVERIVVGVNEGWYQRQ
jgi:hypothetical protein